MINHFQSLLSNFNMRHYTSDDRTVRVWAAPATAPTPAEVAHLRRYAEEQRAAAETSGRELAAANARADVASARVRCLEGDAGALRGCSLEAGRCRLTRG